MNAIVYVIRDAGGEYVSAKGRTPASDEAKEFATADEAQAACDRATDRVLSRDLSEYCVGNRRHHPQETRE